MGVDDDHAKWLARPDGLVAEYRTLGVEAVRLTIPWRRGQSRPTRARVYLHRAAMLIERGEFGRAASLLDRSIKAADPPKSDEEHSAIAWLRAARSCAAYRDAGGQSLAFDPGLLDLSARLFALLCLERTADARAVLLAALNGEQERADALRWVQPFLDPPIRSEFRKLMNDKVRSLQRDPAVVAAASSFGSILE